MSEVLTEMLSRLQAVADSEPAPKFMGKPDRWHEDPHWRCTNGHVSTRYLNAEAEGALCLAGGCQQPVVLTFPEDCDDPAGETPVEPPSRATIDSDECEVCGEGAELATVPTRSNDLRVCLGCAAGAVWQVKPHGAAEWQAGVESARCFIDGCDYDDIDPRGPVTVHGSWNYACVEHWEAIVGILGRQCGSDDEHRPAEPQGEPTAEQRA